MTCEESNIDLSHRNYEGVIGGYLTHGRFIYLSPEERVNLATMCVSERKILLTNHRSFYLQKKSEPNSMGRVLLEKLPIFNLLNKFPVFHGTRMLITIFTTTTFSYLESDEYSKNYILYNLRYVLLLFYYVE